MRAEWPLLVFRPSSGICAALHNVLFISTVSEERGASQRQCTLSVFMLISTWVGSPSSRLCFTLGPPGLFQSLGKLTQFERKGNDLQKNYSLLRMRRSRALCSKMFWQFKMWKICNWTRTQKGPIEISILG